MSEFQIDWSGQGVRQLSRGDAGTAAAAIDDWRRDQLH